MAEPELIEVKDRAAWRRWLARNHGRDRGVWLVIHKKASRSGSLSYEGAAQAQGRVVGDQQGARRGIDRSRTRARRVAETVAQAAENRRVTEWRPKDTG